MFEEFLFLADAMLASSLLLAERPAWRTAPALLGVALWRACRFYYFAFSVIEHYYFALSVIEHDVDREYRFAGLMSFARWLLRTR